MSFKIIHYVVERQDITENSQNPTSFIDVSSWGYQYDDLYGIEAKG